MKNIPDRWLQYSSMGRVIQKTKFVAFKVPLRDTLCQNMAPSNRFSPSMLMEEIKNLSFIIDLTNTTRYYDKSIFENHGIQYTKIFCPGQEIPKKGVVETFFRAVDRFRRSGPPSDALIGVHCTHGVNRTGYLVCKYMIDRLGIKPEEAINLFETARGHNIERTNYVQGLLLPKNKSKYSSKSKKTSTFIRTSSHRPTTSTPFERNRFVYSNVRSVSDNVVLSSQNTFQPAQYTRYKMQRNRRQLFNGPEPQRNMQMGHDNIVSTSHDSNKSITNNCIRSLPRDNLISNIHKIHPQYVPSTSFDCGKSVTNNPFISVSHDERMLSVDTIYPNFKKSIRLKPADKSEDLNIRSKYARETK